MGLDANYDALYYRQYLLKNTEIKLIYTFWFLNDTFSAIICKKMFKIPVKCVTRTHHGDLYECVQKDNYQPFKRYMDRHIDHVFFISHAGYNYYLNLFAGSDKTKYSISKLGIENPYPFNSYSKPQCQNGTLNIVSCSYMVPGKRIQLIIEALSKINDIPVKWIHIGDGSEKEILENTANNLLNKKENIQYTFVGHLDINSIKNMYADNCFDCFVSTTETEGLPVSMMEAISFGIPVIATNVGGVPEIVTKETGILISPDNCVDELVNALYRVSTMSNTEKISLRASCRKYWENNYMAEKQYTQFVKELLEIV